jgi:hypothetical protein
MCECVSENICVCVCVCVCGCMFEVFQRHVFFFLWHRYACKYAYWSMCSCINTCTYADMHVCMHAYRSGTGIIGALELVAPSYQFEWREEDEDVLRVVTSMCTPLLEIMDKMNKSSARYVCTCMCMCLCTCMYCV